MHQRKGERITMNFFDRTTRLLYFGMSFRRFTATNTDLTILLETTYRVRLVRISVTQALKSLLTLANFCKCLRNELQ